MKSAMNYKALNAIHSVVSIEMFALITTSETTKNAWMMFNNTFEGNNRVKN